MDIIRVKGEELDWDDFQEWFKEQFGWRPDTAVPEALRRYLYERDKKKEAKR